MQGSSGDGTISPEMLKPQQNLPVIVEEGDISLPPAEEQQEEDEEMMKVDVVGNSSIDSSSIKDATSTAGAAKKAAAPRTQSCDSCRSKKVGSQRTRRSIRTA